MKKISLMEAYMIETLRTKGVLDEQILAQVEDGDVSSWKELHERFDFTHLVKLAEQDKEAFRSVILDGYEVKFVTIKGVQNLLRMKFNILEEDYVVEEQGIKNVKISEEQLPLLAQTLSKNWVITDVTQSNSSDTSKEINILLG